MLGTYETVKVVFGGDMSSDRVSQPILVDGGTIASVQIAWPSTDSPVGAFSIEVSNHGDASGTWDEYSVDIPWSAQPAGSAGTLTLDNIETATKYLRIRYDATSGGTGAVFYDGSSDHGKLPIVVIKD